MTVSRLNGIGIVWTIIFLCASAFGDAPQTYLGFSPPSSEPEIFAPGVVSSADQREMGCAISPDGTEFYFCRPLESGPDVGIWIVKEQDGQLTAPQVVAFSGEFRDFNPFITPDGQYLIFYRMSYEGHETAKGSYVVDRIDDTWGEPRFLVDLYCVTTTDFATFYCTLGSRENEEGHDLASMTLQGEILTAPQALPGEINSEAWDAHGCISGDGRCLVFDSKRPGTLDRVDMYLSCRCVDGTWSAAVNLGPTINTGHRHMPMLSADGKVLFFSADDDIWWVSLEGAELPQE